MCAELDALKREVAQVFREVKKIRRSRDVSFDEDAELNHEKHNASTPCLSTCSLGMRGNRAPQGIDPL